MSISPTDIAHLKEAAEAAWSARWQTAWDMNHDGSVNLTDVWLFLRWVFFAPGDFVLLALMLYTTGFAALVGIGTQMLFGAVSGAISAVVWILVFGFFGTRG
jgi:hypothetical protein